MNLTTTTTFRSDHDPILVEIDFTKFLSEKSYWRHINALLKDPQYVYRIKNHFRLTLAKYVIKLVNWGGVPLLLSAFFVSLPGTVALDTVVSEPAAAAATNAPAAAIVVISSLPWG